MANFLIPDHVKGYIKTPFTQYINPEITERLPGWYNTNANREVVWVDDTEGTGYGSYVVDLAAYPNAKLLKFVNRNNSYRLIVMLNGVGDIVTYTRAGTVGMEMLIEIPAEAAWLVIPENIQDPKNLIALSDIGYNSTDVTKWVKNWADLAVTMERDGLSGVFLSVEQAVVLVEDGADMVRDLFTADGLYARANFEIWRRENLGFDYKLASDSPLNFATYSESDDEVEISAEKRDFNSLVSSFGRTKYDFLAREVVDGYWNYKHNSVMAGGDWTIAEAEQSVYRVGETYGDGITNQTLSINLDESAIPFGGTLNDIKGQTLTGVVAGNATAPGVTPDEYFFKVDPDYQGNFTFRLRFKFRVSWAEAFTQNYPILFLAYKAMDGTVTVVERYDTDGGNTSYNLNFDSDITMPPGAKLQFFWYYMGGEPYQVAWTFKVENFEYFAIRYRDKSLRAESWDVCSLETMANYLLKKMSSDFEKKYRAVVSIQESFYNGPIMLCAAETIRGYGEKAYFHASFSDFIEFMQFIGCEWSVDEDAGIVTFAPRDNFFDPSKTALSLSEGETAGLMVRADDEYAYSSAKVGYERPDIETINGKFTPHGTFEYTLGYHGADFEKQQLEIISPYKTDPIELELLSWSQPSKDKDTKSDNDLFAVAMEDNRDGTFSEFRGYQHVITGDFGLSLELFNAPFAPRRIAEANRSKFGINSKLLTFTATDAYREANFSDPAMGTPYDSVALSDALFMPVIYEFEAGTHLDLPGVDLRAGLVEFSYRGRQYRGYIKQLVKNYCYDQSTTWQLFGNKV